MDFESIQWRGQQRVFGLMTFPSEEFCVRTYANLEMMANGTKGPRAISI